MDQLNIASYNEVSGYNPLLFCGGGHDDEHPAQEGARCCTVMVFHQNQNRQLSVHSMIAQNLVLALLVVGKSGTTGKTAILATILQC